MIPEWLTWQAVRLFFGGLWTKAAPFLADHWRDVAMALMALLIWHQHGQLAACHTFRADVKAAAPKAAAAQATANHRPAAISQAIAETSDAQAPAYYRALHTAADAHAVRMRPAPDRGSAGGADLPGTDPDQQGVHGSAAEAVSDLVCRPRAEDDWLVSMAGRAAEMYTDAQGWLISGIAVPADPAPRSDTAPGAPPAR